MLYIHIHVTYSVNDYFRYACLPGFSMTGTPSQLCANDGTFTGDAPACNAIVPTDDYTNEQDVKVNVEKNSGSGLDLSGR